MGAVLWRLPLARQLGSMRSRSPSPQAVLAQGDDPHGGSELAARISRSSAGVRRGRSCLKGERRSRPPPPRNDNPRTRSSLAFLPPPRTTPAVSRCPHLPPPCFGALCPASDPALAGP